MALAASAQEFARLFSQQPEGSRLCATAPGRGRGIDRRL